MTLDLSEYETAEAAARALHEYLMDEQEAHGARLWAPDENPRGNGCWAVSWEDGPREWAVKLTGGESMYAAWAVMGGADHDPAPEVTGFYGGSEWLAEPHYAFDLQFHE